MDKRNRIVLATNFTEQEKPARDAAIWLSAKLEAQVQLLHIYEPDPVAKGLNRQELKNLVLSFQENLQARANSFMRGTNFANAAPLLPIRGYFNKRLVQLAQLKTWQGMVFRIRHPFDVRDYIFGHVFDDIIALANCVLLFIPDDKPFLPFAKIIYPTKLMYDNLLGLYQIDMLAQMLNIPVLLLHVENSNLPIAPSMLPQYIEALDRILDCRFEVKIVRAPSIAYALNNETQAENNQALTVVFHRKRNFWANFFLDDFAIRLLRSFNKPLLVLRENTSLTA